jgi:hypothetical protein
LWSQKIALKRLIWSHFKCASFMGGVHARLHEINTCHINCECRWLYYYKISVLWKLHMQTHDSDPEISEMWQVNAKLPVVCSKSLYPELIFWKIQKIFERFTHNLHYSYNLPLTFRIYEVQIWCYRKVWLSK